jgi:hypothetical protein
LANGDHKPIWMTELGLASINATCSAGAWAGQTVAGVSEADQGGCGGGRCRLRGAHTSLSASVIAVLTFAWAVAASAALGSSVDAPGLAEGPLIAGAGLVWEGSDGVMLTDTAGRSSVLAPPDVPNWDNLLDLAWFGRDWWAVARPSGVFAGRIGGPLRELSLLRKCNPGSTSLAPGVAVAQYAVSGDQLYAALPSSCLARRAGPFGAVLDFDLRSRRWHVLASMPGTLDYMAASGEYLALAYWRGSPRSSAERRLLVRVFDAPTGALVNQVTPPQNTNGISTNGTSVIQVDDYGDVLVTVGCCGSSPGQLAQVAQPPETRGWWWARAGSTVGHGTQLGSDGVLSDGRVAFLSAEVSGLGRKTIDVTNLLAGTTRTVVAFSGSVSAHGLALSGNELAWAQQSTVVNVVGGPLAGGGSFEECKDVPLSPVELASLDLRRISSPPAVVTGVPIPPQYANEPPCIEA